MEKKPNKLHIKKGDLVKALAGDHRKDTPAKVLKVVPEKGAAIVEGYNVVTKHVKPSASNPNGGIEKKEALINLSNLMVVEASTGKPTRTGRKLNEKGNLQRYSKKTNKFI